MENVILVHSLENSVLNVQIVFVKHALKVLLIIIYVKVVQN